MSRIKLFIPLILFAVLAFIFWDVLTREHYDPQDLPSALIGQPVPEFALAQVNDDKLLHRKDIIGQVMIINIWATWCITCRVEHTYLLELAKAGVNIVGVDYKDEKARAQAWIQELGNPYSVILFDGEGTLGLDLGVYGAPENYVVDKKGVIRLKHVGNIDAAVWQEKIQPLYLKLQKE